MMHFVPLRGRQRADRAPCRRTASQMCTHRTHALRTRQFGRRRLSKRTDLSWPDVAVAWRRSATPRTQHRRTDWTLAVALLAQATDRDARQLAALDEICAGRSAASPWASRVRQTWIVLAATASALLAKRERARRTSSRRERGCRRLSGHARRAMGCTEQSRALARTTSGARSKFETWSPRPRE